MRGECVETVYEAELCDLFAEECFVAQPFHATTGTKGQETSSQTLKAHLESLGVRFPVLGAAAVTVDVKGKKIERDGAHALAEMLERNQTATVLNVDRNELGDAGAQLLADALKQNRGLTQLNLRSNKIGDKGAESLAEALRHNMTLAKLSLGRNAFGNRGAWALEDALRTNRTLTHLDMEGLLGANVAWRGILKALDANRALSGALFQAVANGERLQLRELLLQGACPVSDKLETVLHVAVARGDPFVIEEVIVGTSLVLPLIASTAGGQCARDALISFAAEHPNLQFGPATRACTAEDRTMDHLMAVIAKAGPRHVKPKMGTVELDAALGILEKETMVLIPVVLARLDLPIWLSKVSAEVANIREEHRVLAEQLNPLEWQAAFELVSHCLKNLPRQSVQQTIEKLRAAEQVVIVAGAPAQAMLEARHDARLQLQAIVAEELQSVFAAIAAADREASCLKSMGFTPADTGDVREESKEVVLPDVLPDLSELISEEQSLVCAGNVLREATISAWSCGGFDPCKDGERYVNTQNVVLSMLRTSCLGSVRQEMQGARQKLKRRFCARALAVAKVRQQMLQYANELKEHSSNLDRTIEAFPRIPLVMDRVDKAHKELNRAKIQARRALEDVELGDASDEQAAAAQEKVAAARASHEDAIAMLITLRQAGYPEVRCAGAAPRDQFDVVPRIAYSEFEMVHHYVNGTFEDVKIGGGMFADVFVVELPASGRCAFKQFRKAVNERELMREAAAMWDVRHDDHVVRLFKVCTDKGHQGLLLELMEGGSLGDRLRREKLSEVEALQVLHDVAAGLVAMHQHKHVHLDVKADNVFLTKAGCAKLGDFGSSKEVRATLHDTKFALTFHWTAPELLSDMPQASPAADVWSFGMLMFETLIGEVPFEDIESFNIMHAIRGGTFPDVTKVDEKLRTIMRSCWNFDARQRPTAAQVLQQIQAHMQRQCLWCTEQANLTRGLLCRNKHSSVACACQR